MDERTDDDGAVVFRHASAMGLERVETADSALPVRTVAGLAQGEESGQSSDGVECMPGCGND
jgi:hypothetical protein